MMRNSFIKIVMIVFAAGCFFPSLARAGAAVGAIKQRQIMEQEAYQQAIAEEMVRRQQQEMIQQYMAAYQQAAVAQYVESQQQGVMVAAAQQQMAQQYMAQQMVQEVAAYQEALRVWTAESVPLDYAMVQNNLGVAYWRQSKRGEQEVNLRRAITA